MRNIPIISVPRQTGYTTFMFKAMSENSNVYYVCKNPNTIRENFIHYLNDNKLNLQTLPSFISLADFSKKCKGKKLNKPFFFDNSCFGGENGIIIETQQYNPYI